MLELSPLCECKQRLSKIEDKLASFFCYICIQYKKNQNIFYQCSEHKDKLICLDCRSNMKRNEEKSNFTVLREFEIFEYEVKVQGEWKWVKSKGGRFFFYITKGRPHNINF